MSDFRPKIGDKVWPNDRSERMGVGEEFWNPDDMWVTDYTDGGTVVVRFGASGDWLYPVDMLEPMDQFDGWVREVREEAGVDVQSG